MLNNDKYFGEGQGMKLKMSFELFFKEWEEEGKALEETLTKQNNIIGRWVAVYECCTSQW